MAISASQYQQAIKARREFTVSECPAAAAAGMKSLADVGFDGEYVVPNQISSTALSGPLILLNNWWGWEELATLDEVECCDARTKGYLPTKPTNWCLDRAFSLLGLARADFYITQACVLLPSSTMGRSINDSIYAASVERVLRLELGGRTPIALGGPAQKACRLARIDFVAAAHPSYQAGERRAQEIAAAIRRVV